MALRLDSLLRLNHDRSAYETLAQAPIYQEAPVPRLGPFLLARADSAAPSITIRGFADESKLA